MNDGLSVIIIILIVGVVLDGIRRARNARRNDVRLSKNARKADKMFNADDERHADFPSGSARHAQEDVRAQTSEVADADYVDHEQAEAVPMLMDSVIDEHVIDEQEAQADDRTHASSEFLAEFNAELEPSPAYEKAPSTLDVNEAHSATELQGQAFDDVLMAKPATDKKVEEDALPTRNRHGHSADKQEHVLQDAHYSHAQGEPQEPVLGALDFLDELESPESPVTGQSATPSEPATSASQQPAYAETILADKPPQAKPHGVDAAIEHTLELGSQLFSRKKAEPKSAEANASASKDSAPKSGAQEILVINVMAPRETQFEGASLLEGLLAEGLKFGQMGIFHRHLDNDGDAAIVYSIANIVEPGSFDFANMDGTFTPGVCMFLSLPTACDGASAYEDMVHTAKRLAAHLDGELKDEIRSTLTSQTIEHDRQRVMEFERKNKLCKR